VVKAEFSNHPESLVWIVHGALSGKN